MYSHCQPVATACPHNVKKMSSPSDCSFFEKEEERRGDSSCTSLSAHCSCHMRAAAAAATELLPHGTRMEACARRGEPAQLPYHHSPSLPGPSSPSCEAHVMPLPFPPAALKNPCTLVSHQGLLPATHVHVSCLFQSCCLFEMRDREYIFLSSIQNALQELFVEAECLFFLFFFFSPRHASMLPLPSCSPPPPKPATCSQPQPISSIFPAPSKGMPACLSYSERGIFFSFSCPPCCHDCFHHHHPPSPFLPPCPLPSFSFLFL